MGAYSLVGVMHECTLCTGTGTVGINVCHICGGNGSYSLIWDQWPESKSVSKVPQVVVLLEWHSVDDDTF